MTIDYAHARELMVEQQIRPWDVLDIKVLDVLARLPREALSPMHTGRWPTPMSNCRSATARR
jgi:protein-L-isoaspartate O-methyltransferase